MNTIELYNKYVMDTYFRTPVVFVRGAGVKIWDDQGKEYLDFFPGWAVSGLGHCHKMVVRAIRRQAGQLIHLPNNYYNELQGELAEKIIQHSFAGKVFFCNSGAEANEAAIKLARKFGNPARYEIITMEGSFHGRTLATITATAQEKFHKGFEPLPVGFKYVPFNNISAVKSAITEKTVAIMLEPIQGEGGIHVADKEYTNELRHVCNKNNLLLIFDEVQTAMGRTGEMFAYKHYDVAPDVMTLAKSLGSGVPIGAMVARDEFAGILAPGTHASTFGGNPLVAAASLATFEAIEKDHLLERARRMGDDLFYQLLVLKRRHSIIKDIRGKALMLGVELTVPGKPIVERCLKNGLLINCTQESVLRIMPPLVVKKSHIERAIEILDEALKN